MSSPLPDHPQLLPSNPNTREAIDLLVHSLGGRLSFRERLRRAGGSPYVWYAGGWEALDLLRDRAPDLLRLGFEQLRAGILLHASQRHDAWVAGFAHGRWQLEGPDGEHHTLHLSGLALQIQIPSQHERRFLRFSKHMAKAG